MLIFLTAIYNLFTPALPPKKATLTVDIQNIREVKGQVQLGLFASADGFPDKAKPAQAKIVNVSGQKVQAIFDVEPGDYALAIFHDVNGNGKIDKKMFGIPTEPYGFSNNVRPKMSAPSFAACKVAVGAGGKTIAIQVK